jgi:phage terminase small subunit
MPALKNSKQEQFCQEYLKDLNGTQAAIRAGYSESRAPQTASRLVTNGKVAARLEELKAERSERDRIDQDWVLQKLVENVERAMQADPVRDRDGNPTGDYVYQGSVANKALELIGKHVGMFSDVLTRLSIDLSQLTYRRRLKWMA